MKSNERKTRNALIPKLSQSMFLVETRVANPYQMKVFRQLKKLAPWLIRVKTKLNLKGERRRRKKSG